MIPSRAAITRPAGRGLHPASKAGWFVLLWVTSAGIGFAAPEPGNDASHALWNPQQALESAAQGRDDSRVDGWLDHLRGGDIEGLAAELSAFAVADSPVAPAREADVYRFTVALGDLPEDLVPPPLLQQLEAWPIQTLIAHEEGPGHAVPLFNIRAAARGVRAAQIRRAGERQASLLLPAGPETWLRTFAGTDDEQRRRGFIDVLHAAPEAERRAIATAALAGAAGQPRFAVAAAHSVASLNDARAMLALMEVADGADLNWNEVLRSGAGQLDETQRADLLLGAMADWPPDRAALAMGILTPGLTRHPDVTESLFELLDHPELGASAALALSRHPEPRITARLEQHAARADSAGRRAALALHLRSLSGPAGDRP
ncbi:HEAT repeat domain-containing protein [Elongatibacter sediminis]|uniref:HEAT repeat domain-containing protein n=1 Tax=Elongatibacter sediminis TaxID=3119006 RepID=A0AAW9RHF1_9GAMM